MKYVKAQAVLPKSLLAEIQKYIQGELVYIPKPQATYEKWGSKTGSRKALAQRNDTMVKAYRAGTPITQLAESYYLAEDTVKNIVYGKH